MEGRPRSSGAARLSLVLVLAALATAMAPPASAGTADAPEITDDADDQEIPVIGGNCFDAPVGCVTGTQIDVLKTWFEASGTNVIVHIEVSSAPTGTTQYNKHWDVHMTAGSAEVVAGAAFIGGPAPALGPTGVATGAEVAETVLSITFPVSALNGATTIMAPFVTSDYSVTDPLNEPFISDRAPNEGSGTDYTVGGSGGATGDADNDGLNDTFEQEFFGNSTSAETADGDGDDDGLNNSQEQDLGTDPTDEDTDGDGFSDGDEVDAGTDPTSATSKPASPTPPPTNPSPTPTATAPTSGGGGGGGDDDDDDDDSSTSSTSGPKDLDEAVELIKADTGYAAASGGGMLAVVVLGIIALAGRWGL